MNRSILYALTLAALLLATPAVGHRVDDQQDYQLAAHNTVTLTAECPASLPGVCLGGAVWTAEEIEALHPFDGTFPNIDLQVSIVDELGKDVEAMRCIDQGADGACDWYDGWDLFCGTSPPFPYDYDGSDLIVYVGGPVYHSVRALTPIGGDTCDPTGIGGTTGYVELSIHEDA